MLEAKAAELQKHVDATDVTIEKLNVSHAQAIRDAKSQLEAESAEKQDHAQTVREMRQTCLRWRPRRRRWWPRRGRLGRRW